jgi:uncharacterized protein (DUF1697 family)
MPRYIAFLRGVSPMNAKMPALKDAFASAGFGNVKTVLSSGNVVFDAPSSAVDALQRKAEAAMQAALGRSFLAIVRPVTAMQGMLEADPFSRFTLPPGAKRVVTFLRSEPPRLALPMEWEGARILAAIGWQVFTAYVPQVNNPAFMTFIEKTCGKDVTTRTWETVRKCAAA